MELVTFILMKIPCNFICNNFSILLFYDFSILFLIARERQLFLQHKVYNLHIAL